MIMYMDLNGNVDIRRKKKVQNKNADDVFV